jgi:hypothetical protein
VIENGTLGYDPIQALRNGNLMRSSDTDPAWARILQQCGHQHLERKAEICALL